MNTFVACLSCDKVNRVALDQPGGRKPICGHCKAELPVHGAVAEQGGSGLSALIQKSPIPIVADFWAPWCGPCKVFAPAFESVARRLAGQAVFVKVNTEAFPLAGDAYHVRSIPTLIVFQGGMERARQSGALPAETFQRWVEGSIRNSAA